MTDDAPPLEALRSQFGLDQAEHETAARPSSSDLRLDEAPVLADESAALSGLAGDVVRALQPHTEADPAGLLLALLVEFGAMVGSTAEARVGAAQHPPALFGVLVGRTARSRKGTVATEVGALMRRVEDGWHERHRVSGFGSGEAFIEHASSMPGEPVYLYEPEFARLLVVASRDGSSVSSVLRHAWDFDQMQLRTRSNHLSAPPTAASLIGHITTGELRDRRKGLRSVDILTDSATESSGSTSTDVGWTRASCLSRSRSPRRSCGDCVMPW